MTKTTPKSHGDTTKVTVLPVKRQKCEVYSRPVGYLRTVSSWNDAKQEEFFDRKTYLVAGMESKK